MPAHRATMAAMRRPNDLPALARARTGALALALMVAGAAAPAAAAALEPHVAAYRLGLHEKRGASALEEVRGGLVIEWRLACDGWLSRQRLGFVATTEEGQGFSHDVRFSSWEAIDGSRLRYTIRSFGNDGPQEGYRGEAALENGEGGGVASFAEPQQHDVKLPPGTVFPTEHLQRVLAGAEAGMHFLSHEVFDGWGFDALTQITSVIGQPQQLAAPADAALAGASGRAWPVSMAYYNVENPTEEPEFEASFVLIENGVLSDLVLDYGEFSLDATLEKLELLDHPDC
jgi:EipB-like